MQAYISPAVVCSSSAEGIILGAERSPGKRLIEQAQETAGGGHGENEPAEYVLESGIPHQRLGFPAAQAMGIRVELARFYDVPRHRVEGIVFENRKQTARPQHPLYVAYERPPVIQRDMMKNADGECQVETAIAMRQVNSVIHREVYVRHPLSGRGDARV